MSIGLYDSDFSDFGIAPFNLEIMKLATYYKKKREIVGFAPDLAPEMYSKMFYRKDYDNGHFDAEALNNPNIEYGGLAFTNNLYVPMEKSIELAVPDTSIYSKFITSLQLPKLDAEALKTQVTAQHLRLSLDNKTVWKQFLKPTDITGATHMLYFHDPDITNIKGALEAIKEALATNPSGARFIDTKFPIKVYSLEQLCEWLELPLAESCKIHLMGILSDEDMIELSKLPQQKLNHINYDPTFGTENQAEFAKKSLRKVYKQIVFLRSQLKYLTLIYSVSILPDPLWVVVFGIWNGFLLTAKTIPPELYETIMKKDSLYAFVKKSFERKAKWQHNKYSPDEARAMFKFIHDLDYETFQDFYECHNVEYKGGKFV